MAKRTWGAVPIRASSDRRFSAGHFRVLTLIAAVDGFNKNGLGCFLTQTQIAERIGCTRPHTNEWIRDLESWGYLIAFKPGDDKRRKAYTVQYQEKETSPDEDTTRRDVSPNGENYVPDPNP